MQVRVPRRVTGERTSPHLTAPNWDESVTEPTARMASRCIVRLTNIQRTNKLSVVFSPRLTRFPATVKQSCSENYSPTRTWNRCRRLPLQFGSTPVRSRRSEEHTSELQSLRHLVCRLLLEKK